MARCTPFIPVNELPPNCCNYRELAPSESSSMSALQASAHLPHASASSEREPPSSSAFPPTSQGSAIKSSPSSSVQSTVSMALNSSAEPLTPPLTPPSLAVPIASTTILGNVIPLNSPARALIRSMSSFARPSSTVTTIAPTSQKDSSHSQCSVHVMSNPNISLITKPAGYGTEIKRKRSGGEQEPNEQTPSKRPCSSNIKTSSILGSTESLCQNKENCLVESATPMDIDSSLIKSSSSDSKSNAHHGSGNELHGSMCKKLTSSVSTSSMSTSSLSTASPSTLSTSTSAPSTSAPSASAPSTSASSMSAPPTSAPSASAPSSSSPSTYSPTANSPSTSSPSTSAPSTSSPSTSSPFMDMSSPVPTGLYRNNALEILGHDIAVQSTNKGVSDIVKSVYSPQKFAAKGRNLFKDMASILQDRISKKPSCPSASTSSKTTSAQKERPKRSDKTESQQTSGSPNTDQDDQISNRSAVSKNIQVSGKTLQGKADLENRNKMPELLRLHPTLTSLVLSKAHAPKTMPTASAPNPRVVDLENPRPKTERVGHNRGHSESCRDTSVESFFDMEPEQLIDMDVEETKDNSYVAQRDIPEKQSSLSKFFELDNHGAIQGDDFKAMQAMQYKPPDKSSRTKSPEITFSGTSPQCNRELLYPKPDPLDAKDRPSCKFASKSPEIAAEPVPSANVRTGTSPEGSNQKKPFNCGICSFTSTRMDVVLEHVDVVHKSSAHEGKNSTSPGMDENDEDAEIKEEEIKEEEIKEEDKEGQLVVSPQSIKEKTDILIKVYITQMLGGMARYPNIPYMRLRLKWFYCNRPYLETLPDEVMRKFIEFSNNDPNDHQPSQPLPQLEQMTPAMIIQQQWKHQQEIAHDLQQQNKPNLQVPQSQPPAQQTQPQQPGQRTQQQNDNTQKTSVSPFQPQSVGCNQTHQRLITPSAERYEYMPQLAAQHQQYFIPSAEHNEYMQQHQGQLQAQHQQYFQQQQQQSGSIPHPQNPQVLQQQQLRTEQCSISNQFQTGHYNALPLNSRHRMPTVYQPHQTFVPMSQTGAQIPQLSPNGQMLPLQHLNQTSQTNTTGPLIMTPSQSQKHQQQLTLNSQWIQSQHQRQHKQHHEEQQLSKQKQLQLQKTQLQQKMSHVQQRQLQLQNTLQHQEQRNAQWLKRQKQQQLQHNAQRPQQTMQQLQQHQQHPMTQLLHHPQQLHQQPQNPNFPKNSPQQTQSQPYPPYQNPSTQQLSSALCSSLAPNGPTTSQNSATQQQFSPSFSSPANAGPAAAQKPAKQQSSAPFFSTHAPTGLAAQNPAPQQQQFSPSFSSHANAGPSAAQKPAPQQPQFSSSFSSHPNAGPAAAQKPAPQQPQFSSSFSSHANAGPAAAQKPAAQQQQFSAPYFSSLAPTGPATAQNPATQQPQFSAPYFSSLAPTGPATAQNPATQQQQFSPSFPSHANAGPAAAQKPATQQQQQSSALTLSELFSSSRVATAHAAQKPVDPALFCAWCQIGFPTLPSYMTHLQKTHMDTDTVYHCTPCMINFRSLESYLIHLEQHK